MAIPAYGWCLMFFVLVFFGACTNQILAQDLANLGKVKPVSITGGLSLSNILYAGTGRSGGRDPFMYVAAANITFDIYGWSVPLSFTYSNQNGQFQQPFNQYGLSPTYKWITAHVGYRSMSFSPYTLNGHIFYGAGVELSPGKHFKFSSMYGRLQAAVRADSAANRPPMYARYGTGFKASYANGGSTLSLQLFKAWDKIDSLAAASADGWDVFPMENLVVGITANTAYRKFVFGIEAASSAITHDARSNEEANAPHWMGRMPFLYRSRSSSSYHKAIKSTVSYKADLFTVNLGHERVDPGYQTLGAYYFNNDLENLTLGVTTTLLKNKINLSVNGGTQKNNLGHDKANTMRRMLASANATMTLSSQTNLNFSYSNFQTYTLVNRQFQTLNQLTPYDNLDTLNFIQVNQSANAGIAFTPESTKDSRSLWNATIAYQGSDDKQGDGRSRTAFYSGNVSYNYSVMSTGAGITLSLNGNHMAASDGTNTMAGPTLGYNRLHFKKKIRSSLSSSYNVSYTNDVLSRTIWNVRVNNAYAFKSHNFSFSVVFLNQNSKGPNKFTAREITAMIGYNYTFNTNKQ